MITYLHKHNYSFLINIKIGFVIRKMFHLKVLQLFSFIEKTSVIGRCSFYRIQFKIYDSINIITWACAKNIKIILLALLLCINYVCFLSLSQCDTISLLPTIKFVKMTSTKYRCLKWFRYLLFSGFFKNNFILKLLLYNTRSVSSALRTLPIVWTTYIMLGAVGMKNK